MVIGQSSRDTVGDTIHRGTFSKVCSQTTSIFHVGMQLGCSVTLLRCLGTGFLTTMAIVYNNNPKMFFPVSSTTGGCFPERARSLLRSWLSIKQRLLPFLTWKSVCCPCCAKEHKEGVGEKPLLIHSWCYVK